MTNNSQRDHDVGAFFAPNAERLHRVTAKQRITAPREVIEDACASAWTILLRRPDITLESRGFCWLVAVATNEALALLGKTRHEHLAGASLESRRDDGYEQDMLEPASDVRDVDEVAHARIEHKNRFAALGSIKPRDRQALFLKGMGYSDREIAKLSRGADVCAVQWRALAVGDMPPARAAVSSAFRPGSGSCRLGPRVLPVQLRVRGVQAGP